ncbi:MAG: 2-dehydro-3-deoxygluconokinase [Pseudomonadota bacterium]|jgi:fructokinase
MSQSIWVLGEALMDCVEQPDGSLRPLPGGSNFNLARAAALRGARVSYLNPLSSDAHGQALGAILRADGVQVAAAPSSRPTSLAIVKLSAGGSPSYRFEREGVADRDYSAESIIGKLQAAAPGWLATGCLALVPPEHDKVLAILQAARQLGWRVAVDANLRPKVAGDAPGAHEAYAQAVRAALQLADAVKASDEDLQFLGWMPARTRASELSAAAIGAHLKQTGLLPQASRLALTFGAEGAWLQVDGHSAWGEVPRVQVADTVGAGDTFWGNCLADWALSGAADSDSSRVADTLRLAMRAAAINCTRAGCQPPTAAELVN